MIVKVAVAVLALLGLVFVVGPNFNYAVFDLQCETSGCSGQICAAKKVASSALSTICEWKPEYGCNRNCEVRNLKCSFDNETRNTCLECVGNCTIKFADKLARIEECYTSCYNCLACIT